MTVRIRRAVDLDAAELAELAEHSFRATFAGTNTPENMDQFCAATYGSSRQLAEIRDPNVETWLADADGRLVGFAQLRGGVAPAGVGGSKPLEIQRLYLHPDWLGSGIARDLMTHLLERAQSRSADVVWLGVWERNPRAIAFYRKFGFGEVGAHVFMVGNDQQRDVVMARSLAVT